MLTSAQIRQQFLDFFKSKGHAIVPSAPIVVKNDPTLMFTNAGMNQFKDIFLGNKKAEHKRVADTQKCLRVSGKHNDLEEVGIDTYHHTMFEMLGNWSFGDYFKQDAIAWAWELLVDVYKLDKDRLYVTIFEGDAKEGLERDTEAYDCWKKVIAEDRILNGNKKDNFWEMGDSGPCGPCTEIHYDMRPDAERKKVDGKNLVNASDPQVVEIWNNVFMQFNRKADGSLEPLPAKHVDTGMGFERLVRALQGKTSNYDTDVFQPLINVAERSSGIKYGTNEQTDIAMRVMADHIRAIAFCIADGQLPSNTGAGYVVRRLLRRAVRYAYTYLNLHQPVLNDLVGPMADMFKDVFPEVAAQEAFIKKVIREEEESFLKTLADGLRRINSIEQQLKSESKNVVEGKVAFELYDTFGFPFDLTSLIARERNLSVDEAGFHAEMQKQKDRSRKASVVESEDWVELLPNVKNEFIGYDNLESESKIVRYRKQKAKDKTIYQVVLDKTPFYAESGGQVGDKGKLNVGGDEVDVLDTKKENDMIVHFVNKLPMDPAAKVAAKVNTTLRHDTANNHSATHLLHAALRQVLGTHVQQRGSLVNADYLRFDFSHFAKITDDELAQVEKIVNEKIRENIRLEEQRNVPIKKAMEMGAMALFGEKYGESVRVITFDKNFSVELCGGIHVPSTGVIGFFKITSESAVAAGVRRIEALTGRGAEEFVSKTIQQLQQAKELLNAKDLVKSIEKLKEDNVTLQKQVEELTNIHVQSVKEQLKAAAKSVNGITLITAKTSLSSADALKKLAYDLRNEVPDLFFVGSAVIGGKPQLCIIINENVVKQKGLNAATIIKKVSREINGGGGGQDFFATAGGTKPEGIDKAMELSAQFLN